MAATARLASAGDKAGPLQPLRCLETAGELIANGSASSVTELSPKLNRARMARRVGSARAASVALR